MMALNHVLFLFMFYIGTSSAASSPLKKEQPLFTLRQVGMICERLLKEREEKVREEYEEILNTKLAGMRWAYFGLFQKLTVRNALFSMVLNVKSLPFLSTGYSMFSKNQLNFSSRKEMNLPVAPGPS